MTIACYVRVRDYGDKQVMIYLTLTGYCNLRTSATPEAFQTHCQPYPRSKRAMPILHTTDTSLLQTSSYCLLRIPVHLW